MVKKLAVFCPSLSLRKISSAVVVYPTSGPPSFIRCCRTNFTGSAGFSAPLSPALSAAGLSCGLGSSARSGVMSTKRATRGAINGAVVLRITKYLVCCQNWTSGWLYELVRQEFLKGCPDARAPNHTDPQRIEHSGELCLVRTPRMEEGIGLGRSADIRRCLFRSLRDLPVRRRAGRPRKEPTANDFRAGARRRPGCLDVDLGRERRRDSE